MDRFFECDATELAGHIKAGDVTASDMLAASISRATRLNTEFAAIPDIRADVAERLLEETDATTPLDGVPTLLKDIGIAARDFPSTSGSRLYRDTVHEVDSSLYERVRKAGLIPYGRTATPEFAIGPTPEGGGYDAPTRNPWNTGHIAGGSSGGAGAAVAAGIVPLAHGSDGGGSIRIPASCCGLVGLKCTRARLPAGPLAGEGWGGLSVDGFLTRSVRDTALIFDLTAGADDGAPYWAPPLKAGHMEAIQNPPGKLRIAVMDSDFLGKAIHPECATATEKTSAILKDLGHDVRPWQSTISETIIPTMVAWSKIVAAGTLLAVRGKVDIDELTPDMVDGVTYGAVQFASQISGADYLEAVNTMHAFGRRMAGLFEDFDVLVNPTLSAPPAQIGRYKPDNTDFIDYRTGPGGLLDYSPYTPIFNISGQPAISLPLHWTENDLPVGIHFAAAFGADELLMALAAQIETAAPWQDKQIGLIRRLHENGS